MDRLLKYAMILVGFLVFLSMGCAHKSADTLPAGPSSESFQKNTEPVLSSTESPRETGDDQTPDSRDEDLDFLYEETKSGAVQISDPIAPFNRVMFHFNDRLYFWVFKPVARGYRYLVPEPARIGVKNFFYNLKAPIRVANCVLQGKMLAAGKETVRFLMNSTAGMLGFGNPAQLYPQLNPQEEDLGQTFGTYGVGNGFYIVWPFLGPSTLRDSFGMVGDRFLNPLSYVEPAEASIQITVYEKLNETTFRIGDYEAIKEASLDPYVAVRNGYIQYRNKKVGE